MGEADGAPLDFDQDWIQEKAVEKVIREEPDVVMISPECKAFCVLQQWNHPRMTVVSVEWHAERSIKHLSFAVLIALLQYHAGRYFALEHPAAARSWGIDVLQSLVQIPGVKTDTFDLCMLGMESVDNEGRVRARKRTRVATNSQALAATLERFRCDRKHRHVTLT